MYVCMYVCTYVCMYVGWMVCDVYVMDVGCYVAVPRSYLHRPLLPRYKIISGTCTGSWCYEYVTWPSIAHVQAVDATLKRGYQIFSPTSIGVWCYVTRSCLVLWVRKHFMLRSKTFRFTCADTWWSLKGSSLVLAHTHTWCYINRPSLVLAQTFEVIRSSLVLAHLHKRLVLR